MQNGCTAAFTLFIGHTYAPPGCLPSVCCEGRDEKKYGKTELCYYLLGKDCSQHVHRDATGTATWLRNKNAKHVKPQVISCYFFVLLFCFLEASCSFSSIYKSNTVPLSVSLM